MAVAFDAVSSAAAPSTGNFSWTHTPVGTPRGVRVLVTQINSGSASPVTAVTYGGVALSEISGSPLLKTTGEPGGVSVWFLGSGIPTGAQTVAVTVGNAVNKTAAVMTMTAADNTEIIDIESWSSDSLADPSATLSLTGRSAFCWVDLYSGQQAVTGITPLTGWTNQGEGDLGAQVQATYTYDTVSTADVTAGWTQTAEDAIAFAIAVAEVIAATGIVGKSYRVTQAVNRASTY